MTAKYPVCRAETKVFSIPKGNRMANQENLFLGQLPKRLVIGMVENKAFNGDKEKNPFNFQHFDADYLALHVDGKQVPSKPLTPDFANGLCTRSYASLFTGTGYMGHDRGNQISCEEYAKGFTLFAFDLSADLDDGGHFQLVKQGNLRLELHFKAALPETINVIVYAEFDNVIEVDKARNVLFDYSSWIVNNWFLSWKGILMWLPYFKECIPSIVSQPLRMGLMSSIPLLTPILVFIGWLFSCAGIQLSILTVMEGILHPNYGIGLVLRNGPPIPFLCKVLWHRYVDSIVCSICFIEPEE